MFCLWEKNQCVGNPFICDVFSGFSTELVRLTSYLNTGACKWISCLQSRLKYPKALPGRNIGVAVLITFAFTWLLVALFIVLPFD